MFRTPPKQVNRNFTATKHKFTKTTNAKHSQIARYGRRSKSVVPDLPRHGHLCLLNIFLRHMPDIIQFRISSPSYSQAPTWPHSRSKHRTWTCNKYLCFTHRIIGNAGSSTQRPNMQYQICTAKFCSLRKCFTSLLAQVFRRSTR